MGSINEQFIVDINILLVFTDCREGKECARSVFPNTGSVNSC